MFNNKMKDGDDVMPKTYAIYCDPTSEGRVAPPVAAASNDLVDMLREGHAHERLVLADQEARCRALVSEFGGDVVGVYVGDRWPRSGSEPARDTGWRRLRKAVAHHDFDVLVFDRVETFMLHGLSALAVMVDCAAAGVGLLSVEEGAIAVDTIPQIVLARLAVDGGAA